MVPPGVEVGVQVLVGVLVLELVELSVGKELPLEKDTVAMMPRPVTLESDDHEMVRKFDVVVQEPSAVPLVDASTEELVEAPLYRYKKS